MFSVTNDIWNVKPKLPNNYFHLVHAFCVIIFGLASALASCTYGLVNIHGKTWSYNQKLEWLEVRFSIGRKKALAYEDRIIFITNINLY